VAAPAQPITFTDPFGLCENPAERRCSLIGQAVQGLRAAVGRIVERVAGPILSQFDNRQHAAPGTTSGAVTAAVMGAATGAADHVAMTVHAGYASRSETASGQVTWGASPAAFIGATTDITIGTSDSNGSGRPWSVGGLVGNGPALGFGLNLTGKQVTGVTFSFGVGYGIGPKPPSFLESLPERITVETPDRD